MTYILHCKDRVKIFKLSPRRHAELQFGRRCRFFLLHLLLLAFLSLAAACSTSQKSPELGVLYDRSAQYERPDRNPVIVIPGILGSRLIDEETGTVVWGAFDPHSADPSSPEGAYLLNTEKNRISL